jgi:tetratricopeptide (TPR) repeat protein
MRSPQILLKFIGKAALNAIGAGIAGDLVVDVLPEVARDVWAWWSKDRDAQERRDDVQALAQASAGEVGEAVAAVVQEVAAEKPPEVRQALAAYLTQVPAAARQSLRRPSDPAGTTVPPGLALQRAEDLLPLLPAKLPRFKPGDRPILGVDWELVELLGAGGFGEVWKARNPHFDGVPPVALKFCLDPAAKDRLLRHEAAVLNQVMRQGRHEGIVQLQQSYLGADPPCLAYEYVAGSDLAGWVQEGRGRLPPRQAARLVQELAGIVGFAHRLHPPIVHRDLKPANILVQRTPDHKVRFKVADFGIGGVAADQAIEATRQGTTRGRFLVSIVRGAYTPFYASPQQMRGEPPDPRDDVYALGVIWHQLLTGDLATGRPGGARWRSRLADQGMPPRLAGLLEACFEDDPRDRPEDAAVLAEQLAESLKVEPSSRGVATPGQAAAPQGVAGPTTVQPGSVDAPGAGPTPTPLAEPGGKGRPAEGHTEGALAHYRKGKEHYDKGEFAEAIGPLTEAIQLDPQLALAYAYRGDAYGDLEKDEEAMADCNEAIRLDPHLGLAYAFRGFRFLDKGEHEKALADCNEAARLAPTESEVYRIRGHVHSQKGEYDQAIADFDNAIHLNPNEALAYDARGQAHQAKGEHDQAIADFTEAIRLKPDLESAYYNRGLAHAGSRRYGRAIADYTKAIRIDPQFAVAYCRRGWAHLDRDEFDKAIPDFTEAIRLDPEDAEAYNGRGCAYALTKEHDRALPDFTQAIRFNREYSDAYYGRGFTYREKGEYDLAITDYTEAIRLDPESPIHYYERGLAYSKKGDLERAISDFTEAIRRESRYMFAYLERGAAYAAKGQYDLAIADYSKAIKLDRKHAGAYLKRSAAYDKTGDQARAQEDFEKAVQLDPGVAHREPSGAG